MSHLACESQLLAVDTANQEKGEALGCRTEAAADELAFLFARHLYTLNFESLAPLLELGGRPIPSAHVTQAGLREALEVNGHLMTEADQGRLGPGMGPQLLTTARGRIGVPMHIFCREARCVGLGDQTTCSIARAGGTRVLPGLAPHIC